MHIDVYVNMKVCREAETMSVEGMIRVLAGSMVIISVALTLLVSQWWLLLAGFVGVNLIQSAFTGFCPADIILKRVFKDQPTACGQ